MSDECELCTTTVRQYVGPDGKPTGAGKKLLRQMRGDIDAIIMSQIVLDDPHFDNTGGQCRVDLSNAIDPTDGHDACYTCNSVGAMIRAYIKEHL